MAGTPRLRYYRTRHGSWGSTHVAAHNGPGAPPTSRSRRWEGRPGFRNSAGLSHPPRVLALVGVRAAGRPVSAVRSRSASTRSRPRRRTGLWTALAIVRRYQVRRRPHQPVAVQHRVREFDQWAAPPRQALSRGESWPDPVRGRAVQVQPWFQSYGLGLNGRGNGTSEWTVGFLRPLSLKVNGTYSN